MKKILFALCALFLLPLPAGAAAVPGQSGQFVRSGLVGHWTLDGSKTNWTTNTTADSSGNSNTGTLVSMSTSTAPAAGR